MELDVRKILVLIGIILNTWNCHSASDCPQAFDGSSCGEIQRKECYDPKLAENCCNTCSHWRFEISGCEYGDRRTDCYNISRKSCYESDIQNDCCFTCHYLRNERYQDCDYGDKDESCYDIDAEECEKDTVASTCCQRCGFLLETGCDGDTSDECDVTYSDCYNRSFEKACCETCYKVYDEHLVGDTDCMYGDKRRGCYNLSRHDCYNEENYLQCCYYCYHDARNNELPDCLYGDKENCYSIERLDCYNINIRDNCCETCNNWMSRHTANCEFGDRKEDCFELITAPARCNDRMDDCCETCYYLSNFTDSIPDCEYGDKVDWCSAISQHECYNDSVKDTCCDTCFYLRTDIADCEYGDKVDWCSAISQHECYNDSVKDTCCDTCFYLRTDIADCTYGDSRPDCILEECTDYSTEEKRQCCRTCEMHWPFSTTPNPDNTGLSTNNQSVFTRTMIRTISMSATTTTNSVSTGKHTGTTQEPDSRTSNTDRATGSSVVPAAVGGAIGGFVAVVLLVGVVYIIWRRGYCTKSSPTSVSEGRYNVGRAATDYLTNRENQSSKKDVDLGKQENVYDYINPDDVNSVISGPSVQLQYDRSQVQESYDNPGYSRFHSEDRQRPQEDGGYVMLEKDADNSSHAYYTVQINKE